ncbi:hypothetical protein ABIE67_005808 [Streptomyces sp. V4I8]|uniref:hypothetical protein n=1 Tax=Streptomyces sp. V4I8 TaxID=3156469 RepID=UPI003512BCE7
MKKLRLATVTALSTLAVGAGMILPSSAQAAPTYWQFQNERFGTCLTGGAGSAFATICNGSDRQDWDWVGGNAWKQLRNRETGLCLMTDNKTDVNAAWTSSCNSDAQGQLFYYTADLKRLQGLLGGGSESILRTSDVKDAVYSTDAGQVAASYYRWTGTHT